VATFASLTILPVASTTHTLDCSKDRRFLHYIYNLYCIGCLPELRCLGPTLLSLDPVSPSYRETAAFASRSEGGPITASNTGENLALGWLWGAEMCPLCRCTPANLARCSIRAPLWVAKRAHAPLSGRIA
jgi:hypothetical protein